MHISHLRLTDFRNFAGLELELDPRGAALLGDNGQGKTNLLESIYYLQIFRSFRGATDERLIRLGADFFRVQGTAVADGRETTVAAAYRRADREKRVTVDGVQPERVGEAIGAMSVVVFAPSDVGIVAGSPSERRRFLDILLSLARPGYLRALQRYRLVLRQRNAALRDGRSAASVHAWDGGLVEAGARVMVERARWTADRSGSFAELYRTVSGGEEGSIEYLPAVTMPEGEAGAEELQAAFEAELARTGERERRRGMTVTGPHRDELRFQAVGRDLRAFGSGGQQRTAAVSLRMVEAETLEEARGHRPIVLLDDVFAELDPGRSTRILEWIEGAGERQVILTAPKPSDVAVGGADLPRFSVSAGRVFRL